jgi:hypothetical protein
LVHELQSVALGVSAVLAVSARPTCGRRKPTPPSVGLPANSDELRYFSTDQSMPAKPLKPLLF